MYFAQRWLAQFFGGWRHYTHKLRAAMREKAPEHTPDAVSSLG
jgi:hypothetical protein